MGIIKHQGQARVDGKPILERREVINFNHIVSPSSQIILRFQLQVLTYENQSNQVIKFSTRSSVLGEVFSLNID